MYFIARYRLQFTDEEFWLSTPAKLLALWELMTKHIRGKTEEPVQEPTASNLFL